MPTVNARCLRRIQNKECHGRVSKEDEGDREEEGVERRKRRWALRKRATLRVRKKYVRLLCTYITFIGLVQ